jgi:hypothetical protein
LQIVFGVCFLQFVHLAFFTKYCNETGNKLT